MASAKHPAPEIRNQAIHLAKVSLGEDRKNCLILDTETTGLSSKDEIIEICLMDMDGNILLDTLIKPKRRRKIPDSASAIHKITMETLKDAPSFEDIYEKLYELTAGRSLIVYNKEFDKRLIEQTAQKYGCQNLNPEFWICAMEAYAVFCGKINPKYGSFKWQKLPHAGHRAHSDCKAVLDLLKTMASAPLSETRTQKTNNPISFVIFILFLLMVFIVIAASTNH